MKDITDEMNDICYSHGRNIYINLLRKYPEDTIRDKDIILNSLCCALLCLMYNNVDSSDREDYVKLISNILMKNSHGLDA